MSQRMQAATKRYKVKENVFPLEPPGRHTALTALRNGAFSAISIYKDVTAIRIPAHEI